MRSSDEWEPDAKLAESLDTRLDAAFALHIPYNDNPVSRRMNAELVQITVHLCMVPKIEAYSSKFCTIACGAVDEMEDGFRCHA